MIENPIIVALDGMEEAESYRVAEQLAGVPGVWGMKVNDLMACSSGPRSVINHLKDFGHKVFADPKIHDIPRTAARWVKRYRAAGADMITIHASGGPEMVETCMEASGGMHILAVTALTSLGVKECTAVYGDQPLATVRKLASIAKTANGYVCSSLEVEMLSKEYPNVTLVVPGIRPEWLAKQKDDQKRIGTPAFALQHGATYLVMGSPIVGKGNPADNVKRTMDEIRSAMG